MTGRADELKSRTEAASSRIPVGLIDTTDG